MSNARLFQARLAHDFADQAGPISSDDGLASYVERRRSHSVRVRAYGTAVVAADDLSRAAQRTDTGTGHTTADACRTVATVGR